MNRRIVVSCARGLCCAAIGLVGCWPTEFDGDLSEPQQVLGYTPPLPSTVQAPPADASHGSAGHALEPAATFTENESNDVWDQANPVVFNGAVQLLGSISGGAADCDIFDLGPASPGEHLTASLASDGNDIQLGFFDEQGRIIAYVDPASPTAGPSSVDVHLHASVATLYAMVATRSTSPVSRAYSVDVQLSGGATPASRPQAVVLVFGGASQVQIGTRAPVDVPPFDIARINGEFAGRTDEAIDLLIDLVLEDYEGLGVTFYLETDPDVPASNFSAIYFGTSDSRLLGLAENIDPFNSDAEQSAIIYTDVFSLFNQLHPTFDETVQVLANVTSHETGHLLGLRHTADAEGLMDVTATARRMLADQWFKSSPLHASVLPAGVQDAPTMLGWSVGGALVPPTAAKVYAARTNARAIVDAGPDFYIPRSWLADCGCTECEHTTESH